MKFIGFMFKSSAISLEELEKLSNCGITIKIQSQKVTVAKTKERNKLTVLT